MVREDEETWASLETLLESKLKEKNKKRNAGVAWTLAGLTSMYSAAASTPLLQNIWWELPEGPEKFMIGAVFYITYLSAFLAGWYAVFGSGKGAGPGYQGAD